MKKKNLMFLFPRNSMIFGGLLVILLVRNMNRILTILSDNILLHLSDGYCSILVGLHRPSDSPHTHISMSRNDKQNFKT